MATRLWIVVAVSAFALTAHADNGALVLFEQGRALAQTGDYEGACAKFSASFELDHRPGIELNLADCHEHLGHLRKAFHLFENAAELYENRGETDQATVARRRAHIIAERLGTIVVAIPEPELEGLAVHVDDRLVKPQREIRELVEPGEISIVVEAPGHRRFERRTTVAPGATAVIDVAWPNETPTERRTDRPIDPPVVRDDPRSSRVHLAIGLGAGAAVGVAGSLILGFTARSRYNSAADDPAHCDPGDPPHCDAIGAHQIDRAHDLAAIGTGVGIASGALAITALIVYLTAPSDLTIVPASNGLAVVGRF